MAASSALSFMKKAVFDPPTTDATAPPAPSPFSAEEQRIMEITRTLYGNIWLAGEEPNVSLATCNSLLQSVQEEALKQPSQQRTMATVIEAAQKHNILSQQAIFIPKQLHQLRSYVCLEGNLELTTAVGTGEHLLDEKGALTPQGRSLLNAKCPRIARFLDAAASRPLQKMALDITHFSVLGDIIEANQDLLKELQGIEAKTPGSVVAACKKIPLHTTDKARRLGDAMEGSEKSNDLASQQMLISARFMHQLIQRAPVAHVKLVTDQPEVGIDLHSVMLEATAETIQLPLSSDSDKEDWISVGNAEGTSLTKTEKTAIARQDTAIRKQTAATLKQEAKAAAAAARVERQRQEEYNTYGDPRDYGYGSTYRP